MVFFAEESRPLVSRERRLRTERKTVGALKNARDVLGKKSKGAVAWVTIILLFSRLCIQPKEEKEYGNGDAR